MADSGILAGKRGLIMGVANDRSIAWGIAQSAAAHGAELAFTYQGDAFRKRVLPLVEPLRPAAVIDCDVSTPGVDRRGFCGIGPTMGPAGFSGARDCVFGPRAAQGPLRRYDARKFRDDDEYLLLLVHRGCAARRKADDAMAGRC